MKRDVGGRKVTRRALGEIIKTATQKNETRLMIYTE